MNQFGTERSSATGQYWVGTLNNYTVDELRLFQTIQSSDDRIAYISFGRETGAEGTPHLQFHLETSRKMRFRTLNRLLGNRCWLAVRKGSFEQAQEYVEKDGDFETFGARISRSRGARTDLEGLREALSQRVPLSVISNDFFKEYMRYRRSISGYVALHAVPRTWVCSVIVYYGKTGTGKTRSVFDNAVNVTDVWVYPGNGWFDGYEGQEIVLFDDFSGSEFKLPYLLKLLDRYPMRVPIKGDFVNWAPKEIYITSNLDPKSWFPNAHQEHVEALFRRFTNTVKFT